MSPPKLPTGWELDEPSSPASGQPPLPTGWELDPIAPQRPLMQEMKDIAPGAIAGAKETAQGLGNVVQNAAASVFPSIDPGAGPAPEPQSGSPGYNVGRLIGGTAAAAPISYLMPGSMSENIMSRLLSGAASGGVIGAAQSPNNMGPGALLGAAGGALPGAVPAMAEGAKDLLARGVRPSLGQSVGGAFNDLEQEAMSVPGIGDAIKAIRRGAVNDLNVTQANAALSHIGESLDPKTPPGRGMIAEVDRKIGGAYDRLLPQVTWQADQQTVPNLTSIIQNANLADKQQAQLMNLIKTQLGKAGNNNIMNGDLFKEVDSKFGNEASSYIGAQDPDQAKYGRAVLAVQAELRDTLARSNPQWGDELNKANAAWADASRLRYASGLSGSKEGVFGPSQLSQGVKHEALTKGQFAKGQARMQDVSDTAEKVLGNTVPDSGTAGRLMLGLAGPIMGAPLATEHLPEAAAKAVWPIVAANIAGAALYTKPAQAGARALLRLAPYVRPGASAGLAGILGQSSNGATNQ